MPYLVEHGGLVQISGAAGAKLPPILQLQDWAARPRRSKPACGRSPNMLPQVNDVRREPIPASEIMLGLNCGGSDGNSGITANPALGVASDMLVAAGGTSILAETPEIYGAEHLLTRRARTRAIGEKLIERIHWWEQYAGMFGVEDRQQSLARQQGRRPDDDLRKIARRRGQGGHRPP